MSFQNFFHTLTRHRTIRPLAALEARFKKKIEPQYAVDPELIGGVKIIVGDAVIDASVRSQLQDLAYTLKS